MRNAPKLSRERKQGVRIQGEHRCSLHNSRTGRSADAECVYYRPKDAILAIFRHRNCPFLLGPFQSRRSLIFVF